MTLPIAILEAMPGTMAEVAVRIGVGGPLLWNTAKVMREEGYLRREAIRGRRGKMTYYATDKPLPDGWEPHIGDEQPTLDATPEALNLAAGPAAPEGAQKKVRRYPVVVFHIPGWPTQDPDRKMVWRVFFEGESKAIRAMRRLNKTLRHEAIFALEHLTKLEVHRIRARGFSLRQMRAREAEIRAKADAAAGS